MTIASEITRIKTAIANAYTACQDMGATMPVTQDSDHLEACIASISGGQPTPTTKQRLVSVADDLDTNKLVLYTDDGINWNTSTMPTSRNWGNVFYGNGKFIVPCYNSNIYAYSTNGINWTEGTLPGRGYWMKGVYGNGKYILAGAYGGVGTSLLYISSDGLTWNTVSGISFGTNEWIIALLFDGEKFVLIKSYIYGGTFGLSLAAYTSIDGENWDVSYKNNVYPSGAYYGAIDGGWSLTTVCPAVFSNNKYYIMHPREKQRVMNTNDFNSYTTICELNYNNVFPVTSCIVNGEIKIFNGHTRSDLNQSAGYINIDSSDNATFVGSSVPRLNYQGGANVINGRAVVIGYGSDQYIYSTDGTTWNTGTLPASAGWWGSCVGEVAI